MSTDARATATGAPVVSGAADGQDQPDTAGRFLGRLTVLPALLAMAWLVAGLPLLLLGLFTPVLMLVLWVPLAAAASWFGLRWIPGRWHAPMPLRKPGHARTPWWTVAALVAVAVTFGVEQMIYRSQEIIVTRDPASYLQFGYWIAHHGSLPIPQHRAAFGGAVHGLTFSSLAFYQVGQSVVPQFMAGLPMVLAGATWLGGVPAALAMGPVLGALAVLTFGGLAARLAGPRWAPLAALALAVSLPQQFTSRSTYSEPLAQILFLGGFCLVADSFGTDGRGRRVLAAAGGLAIGLTLLVRIDGASDMLPVIPFCGLLVLSGRREQARPLLGGLVAGAIFGAADGLLLSLPYLRSLGRVLVPLAVIVAVVTIGTLIAVDRLAGRGLPQLRSDRLPNAAAVLAFAVLAAFAIRPYLQTARGGNDRATRSVIAVFQRADHLPVDSARTYYENSLHWVFWYIGLPAVVLGTLGAAVLARRCLKGQAPVWVLPLMTFAWTIAATLYRPSITPDQPWASRRFVPTVLPGLILLAVWASSWLAGQVRQRTPSQLASGGLATVCAAALVLPAAGTTLGVGDKTVGPADVKASRYGLAFTAIYPRELAAIDRMCAAIPRGSSVVVIDSKIANRMTQVVRGICDVPTARLDSASPGTVGPVVRGIRRAGRQPVLLAANRAELAAYGGPAKRIMALRTTQEDHTLTTVPTGTWPLTIDIWMSQPPG